VSEVYSKKFKSLFSLYLEVDPRELVALHLPVAHDETPGHIASCNDDYKFVVFSYSILQEFAVVNEVTGISHSEIVSALHNQRTDSYKILRIAFIINMLDIPWDHVSA